MILKCKEKKTLKEAQLIRLHGKNKGVKTKQKSISLVWIS